MTNPRRATALILAVAVAGDAATVFAQTGAQPPAASPAVAPIVAPSATDSNVVHLQVGRSAIVDVGSQIARVSLTSADVADAMVTTPHQLLVNGKLPGTISMFVWDKGGALRRYEVNVGRNLDQLAGQVRQLFPGERIEVQNTGKNIVLAGLVSTKEVAEKAVNVAAGYVEKKEEVVNLLQIRPAEASKQVLLRVRFAEVSRNAMTELGATLYGDGAKNAIGRITTGQFGAPAVFDQKSAMVGETQVFSDFLNLFLFSYKDQIGAVVKALQTKGLFQSLAEPNLVAESGKEASFLAGGEFPVPVVQGAGGTMAVSVMFKEFGIRLNFTPQVTGDRVHLKVRPEVSTLDFNNAVVLQGFRIPALSTRRTETELELQDGQTFAIAGLMNNKVASTMQKIPGIGDIPVLGMLFRSKAAQKEQTELVVMITPEILKTNSSGVTPDLPRVPEKFLEPFPEDKTRDMPPPAFGGAGPSSTAAAGAQASKSSRATGRSATAAAAAVSSLVPAGPKVVNAPAAAAPPAADPTAAPAPVAPAAATTPAALDEPAVVAGIDMMPVALEPLDDDAPLPPSVPTNISSSPSASTPTKAGKAERERAREQRRLDEAVAKAQAAEARQQAKDRAAAEKRAAKEQAIADRQARKEAADLRKRSEPDARQVESDKKAESSKKQAALEQPNAVADATAH